MPPRPVHLCHRRRPCASHLFAAEAAAEVVGGINQRENDVGAAARATFGASRRPAAGEQSSGSHVGRRLASDHVAAPPPPPQTPLPPTAPLLLPLQPLPVRSHSARLQQKSWTEHVWPEMKPRCCLGFFISHTASLWSPFRDHFQSIQLFLRPSLSKHTVQDFTPPPHPPPPF